MIDAGNKKRAHKLSSLRQLLYFVQPGGFYSVEELVGLRKSALGRRRRENVLDLLARIAAARALRGPGAARACPSTCTELAAAISSITFEDEPGGAGAGRRGAVVQAARLGVRRRADPALRDRVGPRRDRAAGPVLPFPGRGHLARRRPYPERAQGVLGSPTVRPAVQRGDLLGPPDRPLRRVRPPRLLAAPASARAEQPPAGPQLGLLRPLPRPHRADRDAARSWRRTTTSTPSCRDTSGTSPPMCCPGSGAGRSLAGRTPPSGRCSASATSPSRSPASSSRSSRRWASRSTKR